MSLLYHLVGNHCLCLYYQVVVVLSSGESLSVFVLSGRESLSVFVLSDGELLSLLLYYLVGKHCLYGCTI